MVGHELAYADSVNGTVFSESELTIVRSVYGTSAALSAAGSVFILMTIACTKRVQTLGTETERRFHFTYSA